MRKEKTEEKGGINILAIISIFYFVIACMLLFIEGGMGYIVYLMATAMIVIGILWVIRYLRNDGYMHPNDYDFSFGMLMIIFGIWLLVQHLSMSIWWLPRILGAAAALTSVMKLQDALTLRRLKDENWMAFLVLALVTLILAGVILFSKDKTFISEDGGVHWFVPVVLLVDGICNLVISFRMSGKIKAFKNGVSVQAEPPKVQNEHVQPAMQPAEQPADQTAVQPQNSTADQANEQKG